MDSQIGPYKHRPLETDLHIRLIHLLPGDLDDGIRMHISHVLLEKELKPKSLRLSRKELQNTVPAGWEVFETPENRYLFCYDPDDGTESAPVSDSSSSEGDSTFQITWDHPEPDFDPSLYILPSDDEIWAREPAFEALSYVWGSQEDPEVAFVEGSTGEAIGSINLGPNLASALHNLRYADRPRTLWVDAICINQTDDDEKAVQVKRMSSIYGQTTRVVVWLGPEEDNSALAVERLAYLGAQVETTLDGFHLTSPDAEEPTWYDIDVDIPFSDDVWETIKELASRPWFSRVWTLQEIVLANSLAILQAGSATITWALFRRAVECLLDKKTVPRARNALELARTAVVNGLQRSLSQVLSRHAHRSCFDPHDKVYGVLGMAPPKFVAALVPDYTQPVPDTYRGAFLSNVESVRRWEVFGGDSKLRAIRGPSWVPDLSFDTAGWKSAYQLASGCSEMHYTYLKPNKLRVTGVCFDSVGTVGKDVPPNASAALQCIRSWEPPDLRTAEYNGGGSMLEAFVITLFQNCTRERHPGSEGWPSIAELRRYFCNKVLSTTSNPVKALNRGQYMDDMLLKRCANRVFFQTATGAMGLGPAGMSPGDVVCVILGCDRPLILRPDGKGNYRFLGHSFVYDLQDSQALLGPLPRPWRLQVIEHPDYEFREHYQYFNTETRETTSEDPRLGPLEGWQRIELGDLGRDLTGDDPEVCDWFRRAGDGTVVNADPRLTPDALRARGVNLESFALI